MSIPGSVDSQVYIAAPEVLMLFSDNFDYQVHSGWAVLIIAALSGVCR